MAGLVLAILFGLNFLLFPCEGQISLPPGSDILYGLPGNNVTIPWGIIGSPSDMDSRSWTFIPNNKSFATISGGVVKKTHQYSPGPFTIIKPSTLILNNITIQYNGTYRFSLFVVSTGQAYTSDVTLFVLVQPNVTIIDCYNPTIKKEGDNLTCVCRSEDGNPPERLKWYKDGVLFTNATYGKNILTLTNVSKDDSGNYTCVGQSHTIKVEKSIKVIVYYKPRNTTLTPESAVIVGTPVVLTCKSDGLPEPTYIITHRNGSVVNTSNTYTIPEVMDSHNKTCTYICIASNKLGNDSACSDLTPVTSPPTTISTTTPSSASSTSSSTKKEPSPSGNTTTMSTKPPDPSDPPCPWWCWLIIIIAILLVLLVIGFVVYRYKKKEKDGYRGNADVSPGEGGEFGINHYELDGEPSGGADNTYATVSSETKSKPPPENTTPDVYASVNKENREGKPLYATLDSLALEQGDKSKKKPKDERPPQTEYASIDFAKIGKNDE